jgi:hypothetical protein
MFEAGWQAAVRNQARTIHRWAWPAVAASATAAAAAFLMTLVLRPDLPGTERIVYVPVNPASAGLTPDAFPNKTADRRGSEPEMPEQMVPPVPDVPARVPVAGSPHGLAPYLDFRNGLLSRAPELRWPSAEISAGFGPPTQPASYADFRDRLLRNTSG